MKMTLPPGRTGLIFLLLFTVFLLFRSVLSQQPAKKAESRRQEEAGEYYRKWLNQDVIYIISRDERNVFLNLTNDEEREQFIEQFWFRRDPDQRTAVNEFKEEHYRRIAYANERFSSGLPGWKTDRGRVYIIHGPPDELQPHPAGGPYDRSPWEGGGTTVAYPYEVWRYRYIEGMGQDVVLEFVDPSYSGEYSLALDPEEKDAFLHVPTLGLTDDEIEGLSTRADRPYFNPLSEVNPGYYRRQDYPFDRYFRWNQVQHAPEIRYKDLQQIVQVDISYDQIPFRLRQDYFRLSDDLVLVPISIEIQNKDLTFTEDNGLKLAQIAVYGLITSITNRVMAEFDDDLMVSFPAETFQNAVLGSSVYQKVVTLDRKYRYKLDFVVKDLNGGNTGVVRQAVVPPVFSEEKLAASSLILSDFVRMLEEAVKNDQMFVIGDVWIRPSLSKIFHVDRTLGVYVQLYNTGLDQTTLSPSLKVQCEVRRRGETVLRVVDEAGESIQLASERRVVLLKELSIRDLEPGQYELVLEVTDRVKDQSLELKDRFQVQ